MENVNAEGLAKDNQPQTATTLEARLDYASRGWYTFPANLSGGKKKSHKTKELSGGQNWGKTIDPDEIRRDHRQWPNAGAGIATGKESGIFVVEADTPEGHNVDGIASLKALEKKYSPLPETLMAESPTGSPHRYYNWPKDVVIRNSASKIAPGVDIRGEGGFVAAPPTRTAKGVYRWLNDLPVANAPQWLIDLATGKATPASNIVDFPARSEWFMEQLKLHAGKGLSTDPDDFLPEATTEEIKAAVMSIVIDGEPVWFEVGCAIANELGEDGWQLFHEWSQTSPLYQTEAYVREKWDHLLRNCKREGYDYHVGTIFHYANEADPNWRDGLVELEPTIVEPPKVDEWPSMDEAAYHGIIGEVVRTIEPESEADPVAILIQLIVAAGSMVGRQAYYQVESDKHHANLFAAAVGETSKARKGTSWGRVKDVCSYADTDWTERHIGSGLSSGEGLIHQVRDRVTKPAKPKKEGDKKSKKEGDRVAPETRTLSDWASLPWHDGFEEVIDPGVSDKRFMALEAELSGLLKVMERSGNIISPLFRLAWDGGDLQTLTRNNALKATKPHISTIGHITIDELRSCLTHTDAANGFANRFLFFLVRRSKELPMGGNLDEKVIQGLGKRMGEAIRFRRKSLGDSFRVAFSPEGEQRWREVYGRLTKGNPGLFGAVTARGEAQVVRIALVYAVLDKSDLIELPHIEAGLAVWDYCERSAKHIFGEMLGDNVADTILAGLKQVFPGGLSRTEIIRDLFGGHGRSSAISAALARLKVLGLAEVDVEKTRGRSTEVWTYMPPKGT